jgi:predicted nucleotidyltransferase
MQCPPRDRLLEALVEGLVSAFKGVFGDRLVSLVLYGSYARGDYRSDSDIDLIVVLEEVGDRLELHRELDLVEEALRPVFDCLREAGLRPVLSPVVLDRESASITRPLYLDAVFDARVLYDRGGFMTGVLERVRRRLEEYGAERRRVGSKWVTVLKREYKYGEVIEL